MRGIKASKVSANAVGGSQVWNKSQKSIQMLSAKQFQDPNHRAFEISNSQTHWLVMFSIDELANYEHL